MRMYGEVMGHEAQKNADAWCDNFDEKVKYLKERTDGLAPGQRAQGILQPGT